MSAFIYILATVTKSKPNSAEKNKWNVSFSLSFMKNVLLFLSECETQTAFEVFFW